MAFLVRRTLFVFLASSFFAFLRHARASTLNAAEPRKAVMRRDIAAENADLASPQAVEAPGKAAGSLLETSSEFWPFAHVPEIEVYVINRDERRDRCRCMAEQLQEVKHAVFRQRAVSSDECYSLGLRDDRPTLYGSRNHSAEKSLFCSNFLVWQKAQERDAEFVMIIEDDAGLHPKFWNVVYDFLSKCNDINYITVDPKKATGRLVYDRIQQCEGFSNTYRPTRDQDYWGTGVQIIRKTYLRHMLSTARKHGMGPMDVWWMMRINDGSSVAWMPNILGQSEIHKFVAACGASAEKSDVEARKGSSLLQTHALQRNEGDLPRLTCV
eukprot:TRINITY_DN32203_c0_g1_i1.p1 TRINITY_DN32203_c0_g1~~TRINITY_DN32203_c0_g1_i1.p1  ORF type:complete len:326 (-),score=45.91 TRINITY_DN32203_c0_g1_i1:94-1071(-)